MNTLKLQPATIKDLYEISLKSTNARSKRVYIYEKSDLSSVIGQDKAEELREQFLKNNISIQQITNNPNLPDFTNNNEFINQCMLFRYIPKVNFAIEYEILVFDSTVAVYTFEEEVKLLVIEDEVFARNQIQLFQNLWEQAQLPKLGFDYSPNHSFYNSIDLFIDKKQVIVWPDKEAKDAYDYLDQKGLEIFMKDILESDQKYYKGSDYIVVFIWSHEGQKMADVWKFDANYIDDRSGPLSEVRIYKEGKLCTDMGLASGNTLLVLGYEEKLRRQSHDLDNYLSGPAPTLPLELLNGKDFFN